MPSFGFHCLTAALSSLLLMADQTNSNEATTDANFSRTKYNLDIDEETGLRIRVGETDVSN